MKDMRNMALIAAMLVGTAGWLWFLSTLMAWSLGF
jgi:hypothetical protein